MWPISDTSWAVPWPVLLFKESCRGDPGPIRDQSTWDLLSNFFPIT